jgi:hypothetical protein
MTYICQHRDSLVPDTFSVSFSVSAVKASPKAPTQAEVEQWMKELAKDDVEHAGKAIWSLAAAPKASLALIKERLRPVPAVDDKAITKLIDQLGSEDFDQRQAAAEELEKLGEQAEAILVKRLDEKPDLELFTRIESLLEKLQKPVTSADVLSSLRMIEVLEHVGTPEARELLESVSRGAASARATLQAKAALERLDGSR